MLSHHFLVRWLIRLRHSLRYGESRRTWKSYLQPATSNSEQAVLLIGGLSSNGASTNRKLAETLHQSGTFTWSRNLPGHTGRYYDFSRSRFWQWIYDCIWAIRKLIVRFNRRDLILVGHSTGGLVVLAVLILSRLVPNRVFGYAQPHARLRGVLIFPPFRLQRRRDAQLLWIVAILYYLICPLSFLYIALTKSGMWALAIVGYVGHIKLVPKIYVPSGDDRARQATKSRVRSLISESVLLALMTIYFVSLPPLLAMLKTGIVSTVAIALFIITLLIPLMIIPKNSSDPRSMRGSLGEQGEADSTEHLAFHWLPVVTVSNLMILQFILKRFLKFCRDPLLILQGGNDRVVVVDPEWRKKLDTNSQFVLLKDFPHSDMTAHQQIELGKLINRWMAGETIPETIPGQPNSPLDSCSNNFSVPAMIEDQA